MDNSSALAYYPEVKDYRSLAQKSWNLTDEQMQNMHVHHQPPRCEGGRNIAIHLYVTSPSMHAFGWHDESFWIETQSQAAEKGREKQREENLWVWSEEWQTQNGFSSWNEKFGSEAAFQMRSAAGRAGVVKCHEKCRKEQKGAWDSEVRAKARKECKRKQKSFYSRQAQRLNSLKRWGYTVGTLRLKPDQEQRLNLSETFIDYYCHFGNPGKAIPSEAAQA
jgi:hypothetical protein